MSEEFKLTESLPEEMDVDELKSELVRMHNHKVDVIKPFNDRYYQLLAELKNQTGTGFEWEGDTVVDEDQGIHWQDEQGLVWATEKRTGTFVEFRDFGLTRTRDLERGETKGLSMTKARKFGYVVEGK